MHAPGRALFTCLILFVAFFCGALIARENKQDRLTFACLAAVGMAVIGFFASAVWLVWS